MYGLIGIMALFMGFMSIAERQAAYNLLSRIIGPFFSRLFPEVPKGHPAIGHMMMNFPPTCWAWIMQPHLSA